MFHQERKNNDMERICIRVGREGGFVLTSTSHRRARGNQSKENPHVYLKLCFRNTSVLVE